MKRTAAIVVLFCGATVLGSCHHPKIVVEPPRVTFYLDDPPSLLVCVEVPSLYLHDEDRCTTLADVRSYIQTLQRSH